MSDRVTWKRLRAERLADPDAQAGYETAQRAHAVGRQLRQLREAAGLSQSQLARRLGTSQSAIARLEGGGTDPRLGTLAKISAALKADLVVQLRSKRERAARRAHRTDLTTARAK